MIIRYRGFSLIELIVVILLIGILSAAAVPRLFGSTDKAHTAAVQRLNADMGSTLKVISSEWLLNGSPVSYMLDENTPPYQMSVYGYPAMPASNGSDNLAVKQACRQFLVDIIGVAENLVKKPDDTRLDPAQFAWTVDNIIAVPPERLVSKTGAGSGCIFLYQKKQTAHPAKIYYNPGERVPLKVDLGDLDGTIPSSTGGTETSTSNQTGSPSSQNGDSGTDDAATDTTQNGDDSTDGSLTETDQSGDGGTDGSLTEADQNGDGSTDGSLTETDQNGDGGTDGSLTEADQSGGGGTDGSSTDTTQSTGGSTPLSFGDAEEITESQKSGDNTTIDTPKTFQFEDEPANTDHSTDTTESQSSSAGQSDPAATSACVSATVSGLDTVQITQELSQPVFAIWYKSVEDWIFGRAALGRAEGTGTSIKLSNPGAQAGAVIVMPTAQNWCGQGYYVGGN